MAVYNVPNYLPKDGFGLPLNIRRGNPNPLDNSSVWSSYAEAVNYATTDTTAYVGQILSVINLDDKKAVTSVDVYKINNEAGELKLVGTVPLGDDKTISVATDGKISLYGITSITDNTKRYQPVLENGVLTWVEISTTTVEGLDASLKALDKEVDDLAGRVGATETAIGDEKGGLIADVAANNKAISENAGNITKVTTQANTNKGDIDTLKNTTSGHNTRIEATEEALKSIYTKTETDAKIAEEIGKQAHFTSKVVTSTTEMTSATTLYLIKKTGVTGSDIYEEYLVIDGTPTLIGDTSTDLSGYVTTGTLDETVEGLDGRIDTLENKKHTTFEVGSLSEITATPVAGDTAIVKTAIYTDATNEENNKYSYTGYVYNGTAWAAMDGNYNADNVYFDEDMMVTTNIGYITTSNGSGTIPSKGKNLTGVFEAMFVKEQNPSKTDPSVSITLTGAGSYEVGTKVTGISFSASFEDGKYTYGPEPTGATVTTWSATDTAGGTYSAKSGNCADVTVKDDTNFTVTAKATHTIGSVPKTNKGNDCTDTSKRIAAGTKSKTSSAIKGYRSFFYGVLDTTSAAEPLTSAIVREKLTNAGAYNGAKSFTLNGSATAKRIVVLYPSNTTRGGLREVILTSAMNTPVTESYVVTSAALKVEGVDGATGIDYTACVYEPSKIDAGEVHAITLA